MKLTITIALYLLSGVSAEGCPSLCTCRGGKTSSAAYDGLEPAESSTTEWFRLKCGGGDNPISELNEIDFSKVSDHVVTLNLSGNAISTLTRQLHLPALQKLDLSRNQISVIESDAFYKLPALQRLDLSHNRIAHVGRETLLEVSNLERLLLSNNNITHFSVDAVSHLAVFKQLDISDNPLHCDCATLALVEWARDSGVKLARDPKCGAPESLAGRPLAKLRRELPQCGGDRLAVDPGTAQIVFEGDSLTLSCKAPFIQPDSKFELKWIHPLLQLYDNNNVELKQENQGAAEITVRLTNVTERDQGDWSCQYTDPAVTMATNINIIVLTNHTAHCNVTDEVTNKGAFAWPQLLVNHTAKQSCGSGLATKRCLSNATWERTDSSSCPYVSNITKMLQQFALLNMSVSRGASLAAEQLARKIKANSALIQDPDDLMLISKAVRNYMAYVDKEKDTAAYLIDAISATMNISSQVAELAEKQYRACSDLVTAAEILSQHTENVQGHKQNMGVEHFPVRRDSFAGVTCSWYSRRGDPARRLHCSSSQRAVEPPSIASSVIHCSVQIPASLVNRIDWDKASESTHSQRSLVIAIYESAALLPTLPEEDDGAKRGHRMKDYYGRSTKREDMITEITSPVIGVSLLNTTLTSRLVEPIHVMVRADGSAGGGAARPAVWHPANSTWSNFTPDCAISHVMGDMVVIQCFRLGYVGLLQSVETGIYGGRTDGARFKFSHPAVYVGSLILLGCLSCAILTYTTCYSAIKMAKKTKHALINTWIAIALLCFIYTLGIYQTEDVKLCQIIGLIIHYLSLSVLLWMVVSASNMYVHISKQRPNVQNSDDEIAETPVQKPILGIYLVGWGIALIVCGISGAVNMKDYAAYSQCFLSTIPSLSALLVPAGILLAFLMILFLLIRCTIRLVNGQLSEGTQATENVDLDMWDPPQQAGDTTERRSIRSSPDSEWEDTEHTPIVQLRAQIIVLGLYMSVWTCGAVAVYRPFPAYLPYQEDICSIIYAVCATILGTFILFFYGIARSEVREQWSLMQCYLKKSKKCCRNRSVFDANSSNAQKDATVSFQRPVANDNFSRSGSRSSNKTNTNKTNNGGNFKAGAELNSHTMKDSLKRGSKISNIDLVVLNRQQYRSNNSVMSRENSTPAPELFYNPNQSNVARKFFKKQKQNMKRNFLELPNRSEYTTSPPASEYSGVAHMLHSGTKVNNTNLHVERNPQTDGGVKEMRQVRNPNILEEEKPDNIPYKSWKSDDSKRVMNIYTNVPETTTPQHQTAPGASNMRGSVSEECVPEMRTVSQQCSLAYSSASETMLDRSDQTLDTHSELTSLQETHSGALCSTNEITDTESFGQYIDFAQDCKPCDRALDKSLQDISEECTVNSEELNCCDSLRTLQRGSTHKASPEGSANSKEDKDGYYTPKFDSETASANASEHFENESDIYIPNYQMSEVSIRSHGLYAPSPGVLCPPELSFSHEDVSNRYVNFDPTWRETVRYRPRNKGSGSCPDVREGSPVSASELDELYTRITSRDKPKVLMSNGVAVEPNDSDSCVSEVYSDAEIKVETTV